MIAEKESIQNWQGSSSQTNADYNGKADAGVATETQGREDPGMYEDDVLDKVAKKREKSIWELGDEKRIRHKEDE